MEKTLFELIIDFINALARLGLPSIVFIIILIFRKEIADILKRLKKGKILGQEIEVTERIDELSKSIAEDAKKLPSGVSSEEMNVKAMDKIKVAEEVKVIVEDAEEEPKKAIASIANKVVNELKDLIATSGLLDYFSKGFHYLKAVALLQNRGVISKSTAINLRSYHKLNGEVSDLDFKLPEDKMIRIVDLGLILLRTIQAIPRETYEVYEPNVDVYEDDKCVTKHKGVWGVLLKVTSPGGKVVNFRIYPTTEKGYEKGQILSWEWDLSKVWGEAWYKEPGTDAIKYAWTESGEFAGRPLEVVRDIF